MQMYNALKKQSLGAVPVFSDVSLVLVTQVSAKGP